MDHAPLYSYRLAGRRLGTVFALGVGAAMLVLGLSFGAPWYFLAPVLLSVGMLCWAIVRNNQAGSILTPETLEFFHQSKAETVWVADIANMRVRKWTDGPDTVALHLKSGRVVHVPGLCADSKLALALRALGVAET